MIIRLRKRLLPIMTILSVISTQLYAIQNKCNIFVPLDMANGIITFIPGKKIILNDLDCDGILDTNDNDMDGDGVLNNKDAFPRDRDESKDRDGDGIGDNEDRPVAYSQSVVVDVEGANTTKQIVLKATDNDSRLQYIIVKQPAHGILTGTAPNFVYASKGYNGLDSFSFKVNDGSLDSPLVTVHIKVNYLAPIVSFSDGLHGIEPWTIDIYGDTSHLIKDINQREESSNPLDLTVAGDKLYFTANDGLHGEKLWMSSGVNGNVEMVNDGIQSPLGSDIQNITELDDKVFFTSGHYKGANYGNALQRMVYMSIIGSDTATKIDESLDNYGSINKNIIGFNHKLFYVLNKALNMYDPKTGIKERVEDGGFIYIAGTIDNTLYFVKYIYEGARLKESILYRRTNNTNTIIRSFSKYIGYPKVVNNKLFMTYNSRKELWVYDKTENNIKFLKSFSLAIVDIRNKNLVSFNDKLYFIGNDTVNGEALWVSDGTIAGTKFFKDIKQGNETIATLEKSFVNNNKLYFVSGGNGGEPWVSDGTPAGTKMLELRDGIYGSYLRNFVAFNNEVYFGAHIGSSPNLYKTDGTEAGTIQVTRYTRTGSDRFNIHNLISFNNQLFFSGESEEEGSELWMSDGTDNGTALFANISKTTKPSIRANTKYVKMGQYYYFSANDGNGHNGSNSPLWRTDGTSQGTKIVKNTTVTQGLGPNFLTVIGDKLFFVAKTASAYDRELWVSDGTELGTHLIKDIMPNDVYYKSGSNPSSLINLDGVLVFIAKDNVHGYELWKSDGTENGTVMISSFEEDDFIAEHTPLIYMNGAIYFKGKGPTSGDEFYRLDIHTGSVLLVKDGLSNIEEMTLVGDTIYFKADYDTVSTKEIWKSDGTAKGTNLLKKIQSGPAYNTIKALTKVGNKLFFRANDGEHGSELWVTNGSENGTRMVKDITPGDYSSHTDISDMMDVSGKLYFIADDSVHGKELWISDGTEIGTHLVKDIMPGATTSLPCLNQEIEGKLLFNAYDATGNKVWITDGTKEGTKIVAKP